MAHGGFAAMLGCVFFRVLEGWNLSFQISSKDFAPFSLTPASDNRARRALYAAPYEGRGTECRTLVSDVWLHLLLAQADTLKKGTS